MLSAMMARAGQQAAEAAGVARPGEVAAEVIADAATNTVIVIAPDGCDGGRQPARAVG